MTNLLEKTVGEVEEMILNSSEKSICEMIKEYGYNDAKTISNYLLLEMKDEAFIKLDECIQKIEFEKIWKVKGKKINKKDFSKQELLEFYEPLIEMEILTEESFPKAVVESIKQWIEEVKKEQVPNEEDIREKLVNDRMKLKELQKKEVKIKKGELYIVEDSAEEFSRPQILTKKIK